MPSTTLPPPTTWAIETHGLTKVVADSSGSLTIVDDINLAVASGDTVAITGASGSGKSTLLGLLAGLDVPTRGGVRLFGVDLTAMDEDGRARLRAGRVGFVFQSFQLLAHLTALENVLLPLELTSGRGTSGVGTSGALDGRAAVAAARDMLGRVGLAQRLDHYPRTLSGGEQQRVALARAFVGRPDLLLADEPTGSLDARTGAGVIELMFELNRERVSTLVLVTHDGQIAARCAKQIELSAGRIVTRIDTRIVTPAG
jgi:putative ABC transport system ATP-binding protein